MASKKLFARILSAAVILALSLAALPIPAAQAAGATLREHPIKFYLDPALVSDMGYARTVLAKYVDDMNVILSKNTDRRLVFDPANGIILTSVQPQSNQGVPPLPVDGFEIWAHAVHTSYSISYGGYAGLDDSGAGVLAGLNWTRLYDPEKLQPAEVADYWTQINNMLHELAHVFGAGIGEYYGLMFAKDTTGLEPKLNINIFDPSDPFWSGKPEFKVDPLLWNLAQDNGYQRITTRASLLDTVRFSALTAAVLNNDYRNAAPNVDLAHIRVQVLGADGQPLEGAQVKVWSVMGTSPYQSSLLTETATDAAGGSEFAWGGAANPHNSYDFLRLVKVYKDGYAASARYVSIFDADIARLVENSGTLTIIFQLEKNPPVSTFGDVSTAYFAWSHIERLYAAGITGGCSSAPLLYCPEQYVTRAQMAVFLERGMKGANFVPAAAVSTFGDASSHWARNWIEALAADGITSGCGGGNYCPEAYVNRAQMAIFLLRARHGAAYTPPAARGTVFQDVPSSHWAAAWIEQLATEGVTSGCGGGNYCPDVTVTRAQMSVFLVKTFALP